jgi:cell wall-associated NlpC family hydrolase
VAGINVGSGNAWTVADWASALIIAAGGVANSNNVNNVCHWIWAESGSTAWPNSTLNPLNVNSPSGFVHYPTLYDAIHGTATVQGTAAAIQQQNMSAILAALQNPGTTLDDFASAVVSTPWCASNGGAGGYYYTAITTTTPNPNAVAPASAGAVQGIPTTDFLTNGVAANAPVTQTGAASPTSQTSTNLLNQTPVYSTTTGQAGGSSSSSQSGGGAGSGPQQNQGAPQAIAYAQQDSTNENGQDCSAFVQACWAAGGVSLPRTAQDQYSSDLVTIVAESMAQAGDLVFGSGKDGTTQAPVGHVGIYIGNNTVIQHNPVLTVTLPEFISGQKSEGGFFGVGRVTQGPSTGAAATKTNQTVSGNGQPAAGGTTGNPAANGLNGAVIYGTGEWEPSSAPSDPYASAFQGLKALMLDTGIMPYISDICNASLRNYCAAPNGDFIAWFPDYFGQYGLAATWHLSLIEVHDFDIYWSDERLVTHQYVAGSLATDNESIDPSNGDTISYGGDSASPSEQAAVTSYGVATIDMPGLLEAITGVNPGEPGIYGNVNQIYEQFGPRPNMCSLPTVSAPSLAAFWFAVRLFQENWANQFRANVEITFMPELFPGMLLAIDELGFQCYITSVTHQWNFQDGIGFSTSVNVIAPSTTASAGTGVNSANNKAGLIGLARGGPGTPG